MKIVYKNFRIECNKGIFTLYSSSKKDKLIGYYSNFESALKKLISLGNHELVPDYKKYKEYKSLLKHVSNVVYNPIKKLSESMNGIRKI